MQLQFQYKIIQLLWEQEELHQEIMEHLQMVQIQFFQLLHQQVVVLEMVVVEQVKMAVQVEVLEVKEELLVQEINHQLVHLKEE